MMCKSEVAIHAMRFIHGALTHVRSTGHSNQLAALAVGVAITVTAVAIGGSLLYSRGVRSRRRRRKPLTPSQWRDAFDAESGRLIDIEKLLNKIRYGGLDPSVRREAWPFLLGLYELESTCVEREMIKSRKREEYGNLRKKCALMVEREKHDEFRDDKITKEGFSETMPRNDVRSSSPKHELEESKSMLVDNSTEVETWPDGSSLDGDNELNLNEECSSLDGREVNPIDLASSFVNPSIEVPEEFTTWRRIIRLDAVRMNAEWIPYSPSQANISMEVANKLARIVGLKDYEHLEPCRRHHAARLVSILEAYALYDQEIGYCQGMSDLLSPFVALLDDDCEAFWCFAYFMTSARQNFRLDEAGIRRQLNMLSKILKLSDPHLYQYLEKIHAEECFFVYRMVVVLLRRELSFEQTISLWEVIWADRAAARRFRVKTSWRKGGRRSPPTNYLLLYVIASAVIQRRKFIMDKCRGVDEILRLCNSMTGHLDIWDLLDDARILANNLHDKIID